MRARELRRSGYLGPMLARASRVLAGWRTRRRAARWRRWSSDQVGRSAERLAARYLRRLGYVVIGQRLVTGRGELDLVAVSPERRVVFVEVKSRRGPVDLKPGRRIGSEKRRRVRRAAARFLRRHHLHGVGIRYDVIAVIWPDDGSRPRIHHYPGAFDASEDR